MSEATFPKTSGETLAKERWTGAASSIGEATRLAEDDQVDWWTGGDLPSGRLFRF